MNKRRSGNPFKIVLFCMCLAVFFGIGVQVAFAEETTGGQVAQSEGNAAAGSSVRAVGGQRQRARQVTDAQQEIAHQIAEREEARTRQFEETQHERSVQLGNDQRQRARQITDRQQEIARRIAEREEARTRQMEK